MAEKNEYLPGYKHVSHHEWRTAENSAAHLIHHLVQLSSERPSLHVLDVGTGSGTIATSFLKYMPPGGHITATDISNDILMRARELAETKGAKNITFELASAFELPYPDAAFDVVHAHQVLCHLATPLHALKEMLRVARPGGIVSLRETDMDTWSYWPETDGFKKYRDIALKTHLGAGGSVNCGRRLLSLALEAGCQRSGIDMKLAGWSFNTESDREAFGKAISHA